MSVKEVLASLGSWSVELNDNLPEEVRTKFAFFGHVVILRGSVDVTQHADVDLLARARYVGVIRDIDFEETRTVGGPGMVSWLADEDNKGDIFETKRVLTNATLTAALTAVLPAAVALGTVYTLADPSQRITKTFQFVSPREAVQTICDHFGVEFRVNGNGTLDVGTQAQLYAATPDSIVVRRGAGVDMDVVALGAKFGVKASASDYSNRIFLVGQTQADATFAVGAQSAPSTPYLDIRGNQVKRTRMISESGATTGTLAQRLQLQLNRYNRTTKALRVTAEDYELSGNFVVGDNTYVFDPDTGITDPAREVYFRGDVLHPDVVRISELAWSITDDYTIALRTQTGEWIDLTRWVAFENGGTNEIVVGDLPKSLTNPTGNPVRDRADSLPDASIPEAPTGLTLATQSYLNTRGQNEATILASWTPPTQNTDGTPLLDLSHYVVRHRPTFRSPLWDVSYTDTPSLDFPAVVDLGYQVQVAAVDKANNVSAYTAVLGITAAVDSVAPGTPSDPSVSSYLGQLRIEWDGLTATGSAMPADLNRVDVHVGTTTGFTPTAATLVASLSTKGVAYATAPYGSTRYVRFIAYDHAGNASAASGTVSGATVQVANGDIASMSVGKLTAGIMTADVTISGRFATALTGARVEVNALGLQKWDSANTLLVSITGTEALLTGTYKSAASGRRIEIGSSGAVGLMLFYAPDGKTAFVRGYTESTGIEAFQVGVTIPNTNSLWNLLNINSDEWTSLRSKNIDMTIRDSGFFAIRSATGTGANSGVTGMSDRFYMTSGSLVMMQGGCRTYLTTDSIYFQPNYGDNDEDGQIRLVKTMPGAGSTSSSAQLQFITPLGYATRLKTNMTNSPPSNLRLEVRDANDTGYEGLFASFFTVSSDRSQKDAKTIKDLDGGALSRVRSLRPRTYKRKRLDRPDEIETGFITDEAYPGIVLGEPGPAGDSGINVMSLLTETVAAVKELADIVDQLKKGKS